MISLFKKNALYFYCVLGKLKK